MKPFFRKPGEAAPRLALQEFSLNANINKDGFSLEALSKKESHLPKHASGR
jgi:hypothetical protein